jgi:hypothetical protein
MTYSSDWQPLPSGRPPKTAPLSVRTRYALEWAERNRWSPLRNTDVGSVGFMAYHEMRYHALKTALLTLLEAEEMRPPEDP